MSDVMKTCWSALKRGRFERGEMTSLGWEERSMLLKLLSGAATSGTPLPRFDDRNKRKLRFFVYTPASNDTWRHRCGPKCRSIYVAVQYSPRSTKRPSFPSLFFTISWRKDSFGTTKASSEDLVVSRSIALTMLRSSLATCLTNLPNHNNNNNNNSNNYDDNHVNAKKPRLLRQFPVKFDQSSNHKTGKPYGTCCVVILKGCIRKTKHEMVTELRWRTAK